MLHAIESSTVERLACLTGLHDFDEWKRQTEDQTERIHELLNDSVAAAWSNCLPTWIALGRVRDLSRAVRVPKYWPSFARNLGLAFAEVYQHDFAFLVEVLQESPIDTHEFLCAVDLLDFIASNVDQSDATILDQIFVVDCPLPPVIRKEIANDKRYAGISTVGEYLRRCRVIERGDDFA